MAEQMKFGDISPFAQHRSVLLDYYGAARILRTATASMWTSGVPWSLAKYTPDEIRHLPAVGATRLRVSPSYFPVRSTGLLGVPVSRPVHGTVPRVRSRAPRHHRPGVPVPGAAASPAGCRATCSARPIVWRCRHHAPLDRPATRSAVRQAGGFPGLSRCVRPRRLGAANPLAGAVRHSRRAAPAGP